MAIKLEGGGGRKGFMSRAAIIVLIAAPLSSRTTFLFICLFSILECIKYDNLSIFEIGKPQGSRKKVLDFLMVTKRAEGVKGPSTKKKRSFFPSKKVY